MASNQDSNACHISRAAGTEQSLMKRGSYEDYRRASSYSMQVQDQVVGGDRVDLLRRMPEVQDSLISSQDIRATAIVDNCLVK